MNTNELFFLSFSFTYATNLSSNIWASNTNIKNEINANVAKCIAEFAPMKRKQKRLELISAIRTLEVL